MSSIPEKQFVIYGDSGFQMFSWLTPYIENAGYKWECHPKKDSFGAWEIIITYAGSNT